MQLECTFNTYLYITICFTDEKETWVNSVGGMAFSIIMFKSGPSINDATTTFCRNETKYICTIIKENFDVFPSKIISQDFICLEDFKSY